MKVMLIILISTSSVWAEARTIVEEWIANTPELSRIYAEAQMTDKPSLRKPGDVSWVSELNAEWVPYSKLSDEIISRYIMDGQDAEVNHPSTTTRAGYFKTMVFTCKKRPSGQSILDKVNEKVLINFGKEASEINEFNELSFDSKANEYVMSARFGKCQIRAGAQGQVTSKTCTNIRPKKGLEGDLFAYFPYFGFPRVAMACCAKPGCYETVSKALRNIQLGLLRPPKAKTPSSPTAKPSAF